MWYLRKIESSCEQFSSVSTCLCPNYIKFGKCYSLNLNQSKSTDYQWILTDSNS